MLRKRERAKTLIDNPSCNRHPPLLQPLGHVPRQSPRGGRTAVTRGTTPIKGGLLGGITVNDKGDDGSTAGLHQVVLEWRW